MYVPCWPVLDPRCLVGGARPGSLPFPLGAPRQLAFHAARAGIYHLLRALLGESPGTVLMPDYHSGAEVWAVRAAGAPVRFYRVDRRMEVDPEELRRRCSPDTKVLYLVHYLGWPQPVEAVRDLCRERGLVLIEDCALSLLSRIDGRPLGAFGDFAVFCLYKTLPVPNGGLVVQNTRTLEDLRNLPLAPCDRVSIAARVTELTAGWLRARCDIPGAALQKAKRIAGRALDRVGVGRLPIGDISPDFRTAGYAPERLGVGMSSVSRSLLGRFDYGSIVSRRRANYRRLQERLEGRVTLLRPDLPAGVCPLFFPILVPDKAGAAAALRGRGIEAVEFWNYGYPGAPADDGSDAAFLRRHLLELPIHQDVTPGQVDRMADEVLSAEQCAPL